MMFDFLVQKICPVLLGLFGVAAIDTPGNFVRRIAFNIFFELSCYFEVLGDSLK